MIVIHILQYLIPIQYPFHYLNIQKITGTKNEHSIKTAPALGNARAESIEYCTGQKAGKEFLHKNILPHLHGTCTGVIFIHFFRRNVKCQFKRNRTYRKRQEKSSQSILHPSGIRRTGRALLVLCSSGRRTP